MTKKQIEKKAQELCEKEIGCEEEMDCTRCPYRDFRKTLSEMAEWLLSHQWVSVEDELPPNGEIVIAHYGNFSSVGLTFACWDGKGWKQDERDVTHWMHIPLLLAEEGGQR